MFYGWYVVAGTFVSQLAVVGFFSYSISLLTPLIREEFGVSLEQVMYSLTAGIFTGMVLQPMAGVMLDRYPVRWIMAAGSLIFAGCIVIPGLISWWLHTSGWRGALENLALCIVLLVLSFVVLTIRGKPSDVALLPEGGKPGAGSSSDVPELGLKGIIRHPGYWQIGLSVGLMLSVHIAILANIAPSYLEAHFRSPSIITSLSPSNSGRRTTHSAPDLTTVMTFDPSSISAWKYPSSSVSASPLTPVISAFDNDSPEPSTILPNATTIVSSWPVTLTTFPG